MGVCYSLRSQVSNASYLVAPDDANTFVLDVILEATEGPILPALDVFTVDEQRPRLITHGAGPERLDGTGAPECIRHVNYLMDGRESTAAGLLRFQDERVLFSSLYESLLTGASQFGTVVQIKWRDGHAMGIHVGTIVDDHSVSFRRGGRFRPGKIELWYQYRRRPALQEGQHPARKV